MTTDPIYTTVGNETEKSDVRLSYRIVRLFSEACMPVQTRLLRSWWPIPLTQEHVASPSSYRWISTTRGDLCADLGRNGHPKLDAASSFTHIEQHPKDIRSIRQHAY